MTATRIEPYSRHYWRRYDRLTLRMLAQGRPRAQAHRLHVLPRVLPPLGTIGEHPRGFWHDQPWGHVLLPLGLLGLAALLFWISGRVQP